MDITEILPKFEGAVGRAVRDNRLDKREARSRLAPRSEPYWRLVSEGAHLGYYRGAKVGKWVARYRAAGDGGGYQKRTLGEADDVREADGHAILTFRQADEAARSWFKRCETGCEGSSNDNPDEALTVNDAVDAYVAMRDARASARAGRPVKSDAHHRLKRYVKWDAALPGIKLLKLTEIDLRHWRDRLTGLKATSKQRLVSDLKAALNLCFAFNRRVLPPDLPVTIKFGLKTDTGDWDDAAPIARENQILSDDRVRELIKLAETLDEDKDFFMLVLVLAASGARFSQVKRMKVADVQPEQQRFLVPTSRKGKGRRGELIKVQVGKDVIQELAPILAGRQPEDTLLEHWRYKQVAPIKWERVRRAGWDSASEMTRPWRRLVAAAGLPGIVPYALRHSSIVRGIRAGLPIRLVAALHDTSVAMIERHYSRWITEGLEEYAAKAIVPLLAA